MAFQILLTLALICVTGTTAAEFYSCSWILDQRVNCSSFVHKEICGTDGVTYKNKCSFSQTHCSNKDLHLLHPGACNSIDFLTTPIPSHGAEVVQDFFCTNLSHISCGTTIKKVCGSDGRTYSNTCEFEKGKCTHRDLHVISFSDCAA